MKHEQTVVAIRGALPPRMGKRVTSGSEVVVSLAGLSHADQFLVFSLLSQMNLDFYFAHIGRKSVYKVKVMK